VAVPTETGMTIDIIRRVEARTPLPFLPLTLARSHFPFKYIPLSNNELTHFTSQSSSSILHFQ